MLETVLLMGISTHYSNVRYSIMIETVKKKQLQFRFIRNDLFTINIILKAFLCKL